MSPDEKLDALLEDLAAGLRRDMEALAFSAERVASELGRVGATGPTPPQLAFFALYLDRAYSACEAAFLRVARSIDRWTPGGPRWHITLLHRMAAAVEGVRPPVVRPETASRLEELVRFRHFLRHAYRLDLEWSHLQPLAEGLASVAHAAATDLDAFCAALVGPPDGEPECDNGGAVPA